MASISIGLLLVLALYVQNFNLKSQIGQTNFEHLQITHYELGVLIETLETEEATLYMIDNNVEGVRSMAYIAKIGPHYSRTVMGNYFDANRIRNDSDFREEVIGRLKAHYKALDEVLYDAEDYTKNHLFSKSLHALSGSVSAPDRINNRLSGKLYYNYLTRDVDIGEVLDEKFNEELEKSNSKMEL